MQRNELAIGVFDSGMGGLTVLRALHELLPHENFIYLGDTARLPYGTKSRETVKHYATQMTRILVEKEIKALVIACNTATTAALEHLQSLYPDLLIIGVVEPGAMAAARTSAHGVLVMATETTIASKAYHHAILKHLPEAEVMGQACSLLVALAEEGLVDHEITRQTLMHYLNPHSNFDTVVLGCTHFPVFRETLANLLPNVRIVDSASATATLLKTLLQEAKLEHPPAPGQLRYLVTDAVTRFCRIGQIFLGHAIQAQQVQLIDV